MSEPVNKAILKNYETYRKVRHEKKEIANNNLTLTDKKNNIHFKQAVSPVTSSLIEDIELIIEADKNQVKRYGFKLRSVSICEKPFFRFDASGCSHSNHAPSIPLPLRQISTPHFQYYDELGYNTAYKTDELKDPQIIAELEVDINRGIGLFCEEIIIFTALNGYPNIERDSGLIFQAEEIDPLKNVKFDE
jgi:hypothetical protein